MGCGRLLKTIDSRCSAIACQSPFSVRTSVRNVERPCQNLSNGTTLKFSGLIPHTVERYGFHEGKGTPYRVDPREIIEVLDFLKAK
jgi:hypothetical protein